MRGPPIQCTGAEHVIVLNALREALEDQQGIVFAYVHGSFLQNRPFRDVDVAIYLKAADAQEMDTFALDLASDLEKRLSQSLLVATGPQQGSRNLPIDVRVLNQAPLGFRYHVFRGRLLFSRDDTLRMQEVERTISRYLDLKPLRRYALKEAMTTWH